MRKTAAVQRTPLSQELIYRTALELIEESGVDAFSMRKLAAALGVDAMSIYHHVANKQALLMGVYQVVLEDLELPLEPELSWQDRLRELARRFYRLAHRYPTLMPHLIASRYGTPRELEIYQFIVETVARTGLDPKGQARATAAIFTYAIGIASVAVNGLALRPLYEPGNDQPPALKQHGCADTDDDFDFSVNLLISGIERQCPAD